MRSIKITVLVVLGLCASALGLAGQPNVILVTLDGVRAHEFFVGIDPKLAEGSSESLGGSNGQIFSFLWNDFAHQGIIYGDRRKGDSMRVSNSAVVSLPAYQNIMAGYPQNCLTNGCGRIKAQTLAERLVSELRLRPTDVATISSWDKISLAVESKKGATFTNCALVPLEDGEDDPVHAQINEEQAQDAPPWVGARYDRYTFAHALRYLERHEPRFMFISLNDADEWGHKGDYPNYVATLRQYDEWMRDLFQKLDSMGEYGSDTTVLITTDHGRGEGSQWKHHHAFVGEAKNIWLYGRSPATRSHHIASKKAQTHSDIRPTIEALFGLSPLKCEDCGDIMKELF